MFYFFLLVLALIAPLTAADFHVVLWRPEPMRFSRKRRGRRRWTVLHKEKQFMGGAYYRRSVKARVGQRNGRVRLLGVPFLIGRRYGRGLRYVLSMQRR